MMGRADILMRFLQLSKMDRPKDLDRYTQNLDTSPEAPPLVAQVADKILGEKPELIDMYRQAWEELYQSNPYAQAGNEIKSAEEVALAFTAFITEWIGLERVMSESFGKTRLGNLGAPSPALSRTAINKMAQEATISEAERIAINRLRNIRNEMVHGRNKPDAEVLRAAAQELRFLRGSIEQRLQSDKQNEVTGISRSASLLVIPDHK